MLLQCNGKNRYTIRIFHKRLVRHRALCIRANDVFRKYKCKAHFSRQKLIKKALNA